VCIGHTAWIQQPLRYTSAPATSNSVRLNQRLFIFGSVRTIAIAVARRAVWLCTSHQKRYTMATTIPPCI
jgi:hypothetical protein